MSVHAARHPVQSRPCRSRKPAPSIASAVVSLSTAESEQFRQLRHLTKNALQRIMVIISSSPELSSSGGMAVGESLQQCIMTSAKLSDALFGLTRKPGTLRERLVALSDGLLELLAEDSASIKVSVTVHCSLSVEHDELIVRLAHEFVGNAVKHGMYQRLAGTIDLDVREERGRILLTVVDDGWGCLPTAQTRGEDLSIVGLLLRRVGGTFALKHENGRTLATVEMPVRITGVVDLQPAS